MANRFWVGGSGTWDGTSTTHWAATSGGASGASAPTSSDDVFFDANSGTSTVTVSVSNACKNLDMSASSMLIVSGANLNVYGSATLKSGMTWNFSINFESTTTGNTFTSAGNSFGGADMNFEGIGGGWILQDSLTMTGTRNINIFAGTLDTNGKSVTTGSEATIGFQGTQTKTLTLGGSVITTGTFSLSSGSGTKTANLNSATINCVFFYTGGTFNAGTSTINLTDGNGSFNQSGDTGWTYYNVNFTGATNSGGTNFVDFHGANTFHSLSVSQDVTIEFDINKTQTITTLILSAISGHLVTLRSSSAGTQFTFSVASGILSYDYLSLKDSAATGGATFYAGSHSTNVSGNSGWIFSDPMLLQENGLGIKLENGNYMQIQ